MDHGVPHHNRAAESSGWAAAAAMMLSWRHEAPYTERSVLELFPEFDDVDECRKLSRELGMRPLPGSCRTPADWQARLRSGPIMVGVPGRFLVVDGIRQAGARWEVHVLDPAGASSWLGHDSIDPREHELMQW